MARSGVVIGFLARFPGLFPQGLKELLLQGLLQGSWRDPPAEKPRIYVMSRIPLKFSKIQVPLGGVQWFGGPLSPFPTSPISPWGEVYLSPTPLRGPVPSRLRPVRGSLGGPKPFQERSKNPSKFRSIFKSILVAFWLPKSLPKPSKNIRKSFQKGI